MRRRLYRDHETGWEDATTRWSIWGMRWESETDDPLPTLRDDALWERYEAARAVVRELEIQIGAAVVDEPWDEIELRNGREGWRLVDEEREGPEDEWHKQYDSLGTTLLENARRR